MTVEEILIMIANRAGAPTMDYSPQNAVVEQRESLDWIASWAAEGIKLVRARKCDDAECHLTIPHAHATITGYGELNIR